MVAVTITIFPELVASSNLVFHSTVLFTIWMFPWSAAISEGPTNGNTHSYQNLKLSVVRCSARIFHKPQTKKEKGKRKNRQITAHTATQADYTTRQTETKRSTSRTKIGTLQMHLTQRRSTKKLYSASSVGHQYPVTTHFRQKPTPHPLTTSPSAFTENKT